MSPAVIALRARRDESEFGRALLAGLLRMPKRIPSKFFYDDAGSRLFERITELPEYYPTRIELGLLEAHAVEIASLVGPDAELVEFGAGSLRKVRLLLDAMERPRGYVPIDISGEFLLGMAATLEREYDGLRVHPIVADFTRPVVIGGRVGGAGRRVGFFPGSTIGNFAPSDAIAFLRNARRALDSGPLLIGVDLVKEAALLHAAYNDKQGVTAAFNKNLLARANSELGADFDLDGFGHYACYDPVAQKIEMYLISMARQRVRVCGEIVDFALGEAIHTEDSHKYTKESFAALATEAGYVQRRVWTDAGRLFSVQWLEPA
ncbi:MAG TPA: L-histidine N(alpha)-methyltransferase [Rhizomicrobium sp.]|nr:L-histidine N(alpha)-methyltransferase [Rhizomicrobium sp.]